jgi:molybdopterin/thiamine biosynthesis adenylyltransferase/proteasome lid subunit RPN8/RPN11
MTLLSADWTLGGMVRRAGRVIAAAASSSRDEPGDVAYRNTSVVESAAVTTPTQGAGDTTAAASTELVVTDLALEAIAARLTTCVPEHGGALLAAGDLVHLYCDDLDATYTSTSWLISRELSAAVGTLEERGCGALAGTVHLHPRGVPDPSGPDITTTEKALDANLHLSALHIGIVTEGEPRPTDVALGARHRMSVHTLTRSAAGGRPVLTRSTIRVVAIGADLDLAKVECRAGVTTADLVGGGHRGVLDRLPLSLSVARRQRSVSRFDGTTAVAFDGDYPWVGPVLLDARASEGVRVLPSPWDPTSPSGSQLAALARSARRAPIPGATARIGSHVGALDAKSVVLVGAGSVGSRIADELCRLGVGGLVIVDPDVVEPSDLARTTYTHHDLGTLKAHAAALRMTAINPAITVTTIPSPVAEIELDPLLDAADLVVAALDDIPQLALLAEHAYRAGVALVEVGIYRHGAAGQIVISRPSRDPEARTACWNCTVGSTAGVAGHRPPTNYGVGTLAAEPALGAAIGIVTSAAATVCAGLLAGPGTPAGDAVGPRVASRRTLGIVTASPSWDFVGDLLADVPGQYAPQSVWVRADPRQDCSICGDEALSTDVCSDGPGLAAVIAGLAEMAQGAELRSDECEAASSSSQVVAQVEGSQHTSREDTPMKPNKAQAQERKARIIVAKPIRKDKGQDSRKVHDTKGKNTHGRTFR